MGIGSVGGSFSGGAIPTVAKGVRQSIEQNVQIALSSQKGAVEGPISAAKPPPHAATNTVFALLRAQEASGGAEHATQAGLQILYTQSPLALAVQGVALTSLISTKA